MKIKKFMSPFEFFAYTREVYSTIEIEKFASIPYNYVYKNYFEAKLMNFENLGCYSTEFIHFQMDLSEEIIIKSEEYLIENIKEDAYKVMLYFLCWQLVKNLAMVYWKNRNNFDI